MKTLAGRCLLGSVGMSGCRTSHIRGSFDMKEYCSSKPALWEIDTMY